MILLYLTEDMKAIKATIGRGRFIKMALQAMGMTMSEFLRIAITRVAKEKAIPFDIRVPNETTLQAVQEGRAILAKAQRGFDNAETLFNELDKN